MRTAAIAASLLLGSLLSWWVFPGHTWLQQDTQIYTPILEHLRDPAVLAQDIIVEHPHVAFTLYDETALWFRSMFRSITAADFHGVLMAEQIVCRALGLWGVYLIATALGLEMAPAMLVALIWSLGATVNGPAVLTVEYEPIPRGFAVPILMLAAGLGAHRRWIWSGTAMAAAALIHPPTVWPFLLIYAWVTARKESRWTLVPFGVAIALLVVAARLQSGVTESQHFFSVLTPELEMLQRMRGSYNWVGMWWREYLPQYLFLLGVCAAAWWQLWDRMPRGLRKFAVGLPLAGILSVPVSWLLLDVCKLALMPQLQLMRALLFITAMASVLCASAGCFAVKEARFGQAFLWFLVPWILPIQIHLFAAPTPAQWAVWLGCSALSVLVCTRVSRVWMMTGAYWAMAAVVSFYPHLHLPELEQLSHWARTATAQDAVFLFPDNGKANYPGVFRSEALRAVYVDWKGGGQVNYLPEFGAEWWRRWQAVQPVDGDRYRKLGIHYVVRSAGREVSGKTKVFENSKYWVYKLQ